MVVEDRRRGRVNASATAAGPDGDDDASLDDDNGNEVAKQGDDGDDDDDDEAREDDDAMARRIVDVVAVAAAAARIIVVMRIITAVRCPSLVVLIIDSELFFFVWLLVRPWVSLGVPVGGRPVQSSWTTAMEAMMDLAKFLYAYESVCIIRQNSYVVGKRLDNLSDVLFR